MVQAPAPHMSEQEFQQEVLRLLVKLNKSNDETVSGREQFDQTVMISATNPWQVDYRNRKHIYLWSGTGLTLSVEDIGAQTITANIWNDISHPHGTYLYAQGQATNVPVRIRQTDETLPSSSGSGGGGGGGAVTAAAGSYSVGWSTEITSILTQLNTLQPGFTAAQVTEILLDTDNLAAILTQLNTLQPGFTAAQVTEILLDTDNLATMVTNTAAGATRQPVVGTTGGSIPYHNITAASTNFTNVKGAATQMYGFALSNTSAVPIFVKFYDKVSLPATTDTPKHTIQVPGSGTVIRSFPVGLKFTTGFGWAATGAVADNDGTNIAANCVVDFDLGS